MMLFIERLFQKMIVDEGLLTSIRSQSPEEFPWDSVDTVLGDRTI